MNNKKEDRHEVPKLSPNQRKNSFEEVALGFNEEDALKEANRCLLCKKPLCVTGCPVNIQIPEFIKLIKEKKYIDAALKIKETNCLPAVCGRVCPQEDQCEKKCVLGIKGKSVNIGGLERFVADYLEKNPVPVKKVTADKHTKVAVIGSGPASLTCAADLQLLGYNVKIFEAFHAGGGVLRYGIPEFRLPKKIVTNEINYIKELGVEIEYNCVIGATLSLQDIYNEGYKAIFIGVGSGTPRFLNIPGENLNGVYSANEFLTRVNLMKAYDFPNTKTPIKIGKNTIVVGGGNVAMDAARTALRLGSENVYIVYRRSEQEMPAREEEIINAIEEGIQIKALSNPVEIISDDNFCVKAMKCLKTELTEPDESGRRKPINIPDSEFTIDTDQIIVAIGSMANPLLTGKEKQITLNKRGYIDVNENLQTSVPYIFAGGDIVTGSATVIKAMHAGRSAAKNIDKYLNNN